MVFRSVLGAFLGLAVATGGSWAQITQGTKCVGSNAMCITATVNSSTTYYEVAAGRGTPGWMAIGFGSSMANSPMVILWSNSDGNVTLSQRLATGHVEPQVQASPARVATLDTAGSNAAAAQPTFAFTIPTLAGTSQKLIWAVGRTNPGSNAVDANIAEHNSAGTLTLSLSQLGSSSTGTSAGPSSTSGSSSAASSGGNDDGGSGGDGGLSRGEKLIVAHAVLFTLGLLVILPLGALVARLGRTFANRWFLAHSTIQFWIAAPILIVALGTAIAGVSELQSTHFDDTHKKLGLALCLLYVIQCLLGAFIHWVKERNRIRRPPQNYLHAIVGLIIIGFALYEVHKGYDDEWPEYTGRTTPSSVHVLWIIWLVLLPALYFGGLALLPRQFAIERQDREQRSGQLKLEANGSSYPLTQLDSRA